MLTFSMLRIARILSNFKAAHTTLCTCIIFCRTRQRGGGEDRSRPSVTTGAAEVKPSEASYHLLGHFLFFQHGQRSPFLRRSILPYPQLNPVETSVKTCIEQIKPISVTLLLLIIIYTVSTVATVSTIFYNFFQHSL